MSKTHTTNWFKHSSVEGKPSKVGSVACHRCGGSGVFHTYGTCYRCGGRGTDPTERQWVFPADWTDAQCAEWTEAREARNAKARERSAEKKQAQANAQWQANVETCPVLAEVDAEFLAWEDGDEDLPYGSFVRDLRFKALRFPLSEKQVAAFAKAVEQDRTWAAERQAQRDAEQAAAKPVPTGRVEFEGEVVSRKHYEGQYGVTTKLLVKGDGWKISVTEPSSLTCDEGDRVRMTATVVASEDDPSFGRGKRPTKAQLV